MYAETRHIHFGIHNFSFTVRFSHNYIQKDNTSSRLIYLPPTWLIQYTSHSIVVNIKVGNHAHVGINKHWSVLWTCVPAHKPAPPPPSQLLGSHVSSPTGHRAVRCRLLVWRNYSNRLRVIAATEPTSAQTADYEKCWRRSTRQVIRTWYEVPTHVFDKQYAFIQQEASTKYVKWNVIRASSACIDTMYLLLAVTAYKTNNTFNS
jgi:hypothetical protein